MAQRQIPGGPFVNEVGTVQRQVPGGPFINERFSAPTNPTLSLPTAINITASSFQPRVSYAF
jgi:hypothetical protein